MKTSIAECILIAGSNTAVAHLSSIAVSRDAKARKSEPASSSSIRATRNLRHRRSASAAPPGSDIALYNAMLQVMLKEGLLDHDYIAAHTKASRWRNSPNATSGDGRRADRS